MKVSPLAGKSANPATLVNVPKLITAYYAEIPDPKVPEHRVVFGTSGHHGSAFEKSFNEWHIAKENEFLRAGLKGIKRISLKKARHAATTHRYVYLNAYIDDLANVVNMNVIRNAQISLGGDPLGGRCVHYWGPIAGHYKLDLTVVNRVPSLGSRAAYVKQVLRDKLLDHKAYIHKHGEDMPEIRNWQWGLAESGDPAQSRSVWKG